ALGRGRVEDAAPQPCGRSRCRDGQRERGRRLAERRELAAATLALREMRLVLLALVGVERVECEGRGQVVDVHDISSPGSPRSSRSRPSPRNILLLIVPKG